MLDEEPDPRALGPLGPGPRGPGNLPWPSRIREGRGCGELLLESGQRPGARCQVPGRAVRCTSGVCLCARYAVDTCVLRPGAVWSGLEPGTAGVANRDGAQESLATWWTLAQGPT